MVVAALAMFEDGIEEILQLSEEPFALVPSCSV
jgi:hypothetical protein